MPYFIFSFYYIWFTNLDTQKKRHDDLILYKTYSPDKYSGCDKYNPEQFEILGLDDL